MADRPWWLDWRRLPPSMERGIAEQQSRPLTRNEVWIARVSAPVFLLGGLAFGVLLDSWGAAGGFAAGAITQGLWFSRMTPEQRAQVFGRGRTSR